MPEERRVLVTGAGGFIGRHVVAALLDAGASVSALVRRDVGPVDRRAAKISADLLRLPDYAVIVKEAAADTLVHLAWETRHGYYWNAPENLDWLAASLGLIRAFAENGGGRVVVAGTCAEYEAPMFGPCIAGSTACRPRHLYSIAKHALHQVLAGYEVVGNLELAWARVFHLIGPGEAAARLVPSAISSMARGETFQAGTAQKRLDIMDSRDCGRAFADLALSTFRGPINIASGEPISVGELLRNLASLAGQPNLVAFGSRPEPLGDVAGLWADTNPLHRHLGFKPKYSILDSLSDAIAVSGFANEFEGKRTAHEVDD